MVTQEAVASHISADVRTSTVHDGPAPHGVPVGLSPPATQTWVPVPQENVPSSLQGFVGWQTPPAVHATQAPALHTWSEPQVVPLANTIPVSVQTFAPVVQLKIPVWQGLLGVQGSPAAQPIHDPLAHTMLIPHELPLLLLVVSSHTGAPVPQEIVPFLHMLAGLQAIPTVHAVHVPLLQTRFVPHVVPLFLLPVSLHTIVPVEQAFTPVLHMFAG